MGSGTSVVAPTEIPKSARDKTLGGNRTLKGFADWLVSDKCNNLVVLAGAGISVSAGIPDFRTPGTGLYSNLQKYNLSRPEDVFDIQFFKGNQRPFFHLAHELYPGRYFPTRTHFFLKLLEQKGKLRRLYTQNIDTLERLAGLSSERVIEAHGSFASATCMKCKHPYSQEWVERKIFGDRGAPVAGTAADAIGTDDAVAGVSAGLAAVSLSSAASEGGGGAASGAGATAESEGATADLSAVVVPMCEQPGCLGCADAVVKPDITFFGENLPDRYCDNVDGDCEAADMLIVIGTSLKVHPVAGIPGKVKELCPRLLINRDPVYTEDPLCDSTVPAPPPTEGPDETDTRPWTNNAPFRFFLGDNYRDVFFGGDCDDGVEALAAACGWTDDLNRIHAAAIASFKAAHPDWPGVSLPSEEQLAAAKAAVTGGTGAAASASGAGPKATAAKAAAVRPSGSTATASGPAKKAAPSVARTTNPMRSGTGTSGTGTGTGAAARTSPIGASSGPRPAAATGPAGTGTAKTGATAAGRSSSTSPAKASVSASASAAARSSGPSSSSSSSSTGSVARGTGTGTGSAATSPAAAASGGGVMRTNSSLALGKASPALPASASASATKRSPVGAAAGGGGGGLSTASGGRAASSASASASTSPAAKTRTGSVAIGGVSATSRSPASSATALGSGAGAVAGGPVRRSPLSTAGARVMGTGSATSTAPAGTSSAGSGGSGASRVSPASGRTTGTGTGVTPATAARKTPSPTSAASSSTSTGTGTGGALKTSPARRS